MRARSRRFTLGLVACALGAACGGGGGSGDGGGGGPTPAPRLLTLTPPATDVAAGGTVTFAVSLDRVAPAGGTAVSLAVVPGSAGTLPAQVVVPEGDVGASLDYVDAGTAAQATVTASLGADARDASVTVVIPSPTCVDDGFEPNDGPQTSARLSPTNDDDSMPLDWSAVLCSGDPDWFVVHVDDTFGQAFSIDLTITWTPGTTLTFRVSYVDDNGAHVASATGSTGSLRIQQDLTSPPFTDQTQDVTIDVSATGVGAAGVAYRIQGHF